MISIETMKHRTRQMVGQEFPLVMWRGLGRIVASDDAGLSLLVRGTRVHYTWDRIRVANDRLLAKHTLGVDELGGAADAVGLVSMLAHVHGDGVAVADGDGPLVVREPADTPVHQYADMGRPTAWAPWKRQIHGH